MPIAGARRRLGPSPGERPNVSSLVGYDPWGVRPFSPVPPTVGAAHPDPWQLCRASRAASLFILGPGNHDVVQRQEATVEGVPDWVRDEAARAASAGGFLVPVHRSQQDGTNVHIELSLLPLPEPSGQPEDVEAGTAVALFTSPLAAFRAGLGSGLNVVCVTPPQIRSLIGDSARLVINPGTDRVWVSSLTSLEALWEDVSASQL